jgi:hypothetical protein
MIALSLLAYLEPVAQIWAILVYRSLLSVVRQYDFRYPDIFRFEAKIEIHCLKSSVCHPAPSIIAPFTTKVFLCLLV